MAVAVQNQDRGYEGFPPSPFGWSFTPSFAVGARLIGLELLYEEVYAQFVQIFPLHP